MIETKSRSRNVVRASTLYIPPNAVEAAPAPTVPDPTTSVTAAVTASPARATKITGVGRFGVTRRPRQRRSRHARRGSRRALGRRDRLDGRAAARPAAGQVDPGDPDEAA